MPSPESDLRSRLRRVLETAPVRLGVLFGSHATGRARSDSDVDVGIWPRDAELTLKDELGLAAALSSAAGAEVDLVRLDRDNPLLGREVAQNGVCLFEARRGLFAAYRASAMSTWIDFDETVGPHRDTFLGRLAAKSPRGGAPA